MKRIVLIGAGSVMFTKGLIADMIHSALPWEVRLCDINPEALETAERLCRLMLAAKPAEIAVKASTDRRDLLPGADVVVTTIAVGGRRAWEKDVLIPRKYGVFQPVGDSVLPGGISRACRHIPVMIEIASDVARLCPDALFINYSNPMSAICKAVRQETGVPVIGLCHGVEDVRRYLARYVGASEAACKGIAVGVNHLTWFLGLSEGRVDLWPEVARRRAEVRQDPSTQSQDAHGGHPLCWELYDMFGAFPAVYDNHVMEFFPMTCREGGYYGRTPGLDKWDPIERLIKRDDANHQALHEQARGLRPLDMSWLEKKVYGEQEQLIAILESLWLDKPALVSVNLPNDGQVSNLPHGAILESTAYVDGQGIRPLAIGSLPNGIAGILQSRIAACQATVDAALSGDLHALAQALLLDGAVTTPSEALALAGDLVDAQKEHLPQFAARAVREGTP